MARSQRFGAVGEPVFAALRAGRITPYDATVYAALAYLAGGRSEWITSQAEIARTMGASRRGVQLAIAALAGAELLDVEPHGRVYRYSFTTGAPGERYGARDARYGAHDARYGAHDAPMGEDETYPETTGARDAPYRRTPLALPAHEMSDMAHAVRTYKRRDQDQREWGASEHNSGVDAEEDFIPSDSSGDTPETPFPSLAEVQVIRWADICALVPAQWLRSDRHLKQLVQTLEDDAIRDPAHPWHGSMLVRSPETIGGWRILPDPDYLLPSPP